MARKRKEVVAGEKAWQEMYGNPSAQPAEDPNANPGQPALEAPPDQGVEPTLPETPPIPSPEDAVKLMEDLEKELETATQRYNVLQGKYDTELFRERMEKETFRSALEEMRKAPPAPPAEPAKRPEAAAKMEKLKEEWPEAYEGIVAVLEDERERIRGDLREELRSTIQPLVEDKETRFWRELKQEASDYEQYWNDPNFLKSLDVRDRYTGYTKRQLIDAAIGRKDAPIVANFLADYKKEIGANEPATASSTPVSPAAPFAPAATTTTYVAMPRTGRIPSQTAVDVELITDSEIKKHYEKKRRKQYASKEEMVKMEAKINKALLEGKIAPG